MMRNEKRGVKEVLSEEDILSLIEMLKLHADLNEDVAIHQVDRLELLETEVRADLVGEAFASELVRFLPAEVPLSTAWMETFAQWADTRRGEPPCR
jgi:hypothetical protein